MDLTLHDKYGVNPSIATCFLCGKDKNEIVLLGRHSKRITGHDEAPHNVCMDMEPCDECKKYMEMGIIVISVRDGETNTKNPYRTGLWIVIKEEAITNMPIPQDIKDSAIERRCLFIEDSVARALGLYKAAESAPTQVD